MKSVEVTRTWIATLVVLSSLIPNSVIGCFAFITHDEIVESLLGFIGAIFTLFLWTIVLIFRDKFVSLSALSQLGFLLLSIALLLSSYAIIISVVTAPIA